MSIQIAYILLGLSIAFEMLAAGFIPATEGFRKIKPTAICILGYACSFFLFGQCLQVIDLGIGYATWGAVGTVVTSIIGVLVYKQKLSRTGIASLALIVVCIICLNLFGN